MAPAQAPKNILDYYLLLPERLFGCKEKPKASGDQRLAALKNKNIPGGIYCGS